MKHPKRVRADRIVVVVASGLLWLGGPPATVTGQNADRLESRRIRDTVRTVMDHPDFEKLKPESGEDNDQGFLSRLRDQLESRPSREATEPATESGTGQMIAAAASQLLMVTALLVICLLLAVIAVVAIRSIDRQRKKRAATHPREPQGTVGDLQTPPGDLQVDRYATAARQLAAAGDYRSALRQLLLGCMSWTENHDLIRFRRGLTNRDYYRALDSHPPRRDAFATIAVEFERVYFGRRPATPERFQTCMDLFARGFDGQPV